MIAAVGRNFEIGKGNDLLWHLPEDFKFFKSTTMSHPIIMGRKTFESLGRPLPKRRNIVLSRSGFSADGVEVVEDLKEALALVAQEEKVFIIGGEQIYRLALPKADTIYLTHVEVEFDDADAHFPKFEFEDFEAKTLMNHSVDEKHKFAFEVKEYTRLK